MSSLTYYNNDSLIGALREVNPELAVLVYKHGDQVLNDHYFTYALTKFRELQAVEKITLIQAMVDKLALEVEYDIQYIKTDAERYIVEVQSDRDITINASNNVLELRKQEIWAEVQKSEHQRDITITQIQALKEIELATIEKEIRQYGMLTAVALDMIRYRGHDEGSASFEDGKTIRFSGRRNRY